MPFQYTWIHWITLPNTWLDLPFGAFVLNTLETAFSSTFAYRQPPPYSL